MEEVDGSARGHASRVREITTEVLVHASKLSVGKTEHLEHYLKRVTHLTLNGSEKKVIKRIQHLQRCPNLKVLYLYDNEIQVLEGLDGVSQLTHLHLQNNWIERMENLTALRQLEKVYLEGNRISRLEGLGNCLYLQELHLSNQRLSPSTVFSFEEETIRALSRSLRVLNLSNCHITATQSLLGLRALQQLDLSKNLIEELEDVFALLGGLYSLTELDLRSNPVTNIPKYREKAITFSSPRLALLDKKDIDMNQRRMMQSHLAHKHKKRQEAAENANNQRTYDTFGASSQSESYRAVKHGSTVHHLRNQSIAVGASKAAKPQWEVDGLGVAGSSCPRTTALVRSSHQSSNNNKHQ
ncbi:hypothetical protein Poli38472_009290 [Pythium oligandrum]|uniref:Uncharacterized protein n=1 Tax=Pythium oligandrum TaxID=41045 RepID=A0A8K1CMN9_PYTOL|nr:hypothetical protein Poli38472_009290 [Pythium oligandrum]|eukprot:TMW65123.1 hypothetical protein Poli38472_009290 [Pythium oligandrum]